MGFLILLELPPTAETWGHAFHTKYSHLVGFRGRALMGGWLLARQNTELQRIGCWKLGQAMDLSTKHSVTRSILLSVQLLESCLRFLISKFESLVESMTNWRKKQGNPQLNHQPTLEENQPGAVALPADWQIHGMRMHVWHLVITFDIYSRARLKTIAHPSPFTFVVFVPTPKHLTFLN